MCKVNDTSSVLINNGQTVLDERLLISQQCECPEGSFSAWIGSIMGHACGDVYNESKKCDASDPSEVGSEWQLSSFPSKLNTSCEWAPQGLDCPQLLSHVSSLRLDN